LGNTRGNRYSLGHVAWNSSDSNSSYWDFTWQNMSVYDLPAAFEYISTFTGQSINYIGHSQGTAIMFEALARRDPVILGSLEKYFALGPIGWVNHVTSPILTDASKLKIGEIVFELDGKKFMFTNNATREFLELDCEYLDVTCIESLKELADFHPDVDNTKRMDVFVGHYPAGTSAMNVDYWNQMTLNNNLQMYNYGEEGNKIHYNSTTPPMIDLGNINIPIHLFSGLYDELADPTDVQRLYNALTGSPNVTWHQYPYGHATYFWGLNLTYLNDLFLILEGSTNDNILMDI
jgi:pimeloyl-ACP methyl ester carboxylesterase